MNSNLRHAKLHIFKIDNVKEASRQPDTIVRGYSHNIDFIFYSNITILFSSVFKILENNQERGYHKWCWSYFSFPHTLLVS